MKPSIPKPCGIGSNRPIRLPREGKKPPYETTNTDRVVLDVLLAVAVSALDAADDRPGQSRLSSGMDPMIRELTYSEPKPRRPRKPLGVTAKARAKRTRAEGPVKKAVRQACVERDAYCRFWLDRFTSAFHDDVTDCEGPSEWCHLKGRAHTRNMAPELRHNTMTSLMLCTRHHDRLDGRARPRLKVKPLTGLGADGPLTWRTA